jgi:hypothetical protein
VPEAITLSHLSETDLAELFGDDAGAIRRYRILQALLNDGKTQHEAALAFNVSERTIRNTLRVFTGSGQLESLRSRPAATRRHTDWRRQSYEQALAAALAEDPQAGGDRLWNRARELIGGGQGLSRRTAYRLLAELRSGARRDEPGPAELLRSALPMLLEDPPLGLGSGPLARQLFPNETDPLLRGVQLQQVLREALSRLRPAGEVTTIDRSWWPYLICVGEYEAGQARADIQIDLALSASTYSRAKRQGLDRLAAALPGIVEGMHEIPASAIARRLPRVPGFVGRREEQSYYAWRLQTEGRACIWGLPGSGKTALAAELAAEGQRYGQTIIWHTCRVGRDASLAGVLRGLAQSLASAGDQSLWQILRQGAERPAGAALIEQLCERLAAHPAVIILDDVHHLEADTAALLAALEQLCTRGAARLLTISRNRPEQGDWPWLPGLAEREARLLWGNLPLPADQWSELYSVVAGLPRPLALAATAVRRSTGQARQHDWATTVDSWAEEMIWSQLAPAERDLLAELWAGATAGNADPLLLATLQRRGLAGPGGVPPAIHAMLRRGAQAALHDHPSLRPEAPDACRSSEPAVPQLSMSAPPDPPANSAGLDLLIRLHEALDRSSRYLQAHSSDLDACQIAHELTQLREALPNPVGPR